MDSSPLVAVWVTDFPIEWLPGLPKSLQTLPRQHPLTWQRVLLSEFEKNSALRLHVVALRKNIEKTVSFAHNGVTFHVIKVPRGLRAPTLFWVDTLLIRRRLKQIKPDLVHAWGTERGAALVANRLGYPYLVTIQGLVTWYMELVRLNAYWRFAGYLEKLSLPLAPLVTTESTVAVAFLNKKFPNLAVWQAEHAPEWVFHQVQRQPQTRPVRFIFVGVLDYRKGGDILIAALDHLKDEFPFELTIVGQSEKGFLERIRARSSTEIWRRIQFKQSLLPVQVAAELAQATMMVFPTRADTSPNAVKEAAVAGVPVVASAVGGIIDYIVPGENGLTFAADSLPACIDAVKKACQHPLFSQGLVKPDTLAKTRSYLSPQRMGQRFWEAYCKIGGSGARRN